MKRILIVSGSTEKEEFQLKAMSDAFRKRGFRVFHFNYSRFYFKYFTITNYLLNLAFYVRAIRVRPDVILVLRGEFLLPELPGLRKYPGTITLIKKKLPKMKAVFWTADDPFQMYEPYLMVRNLKEYDFRFIYDSYVVEELNKRGIRSEFIPLAADTNTFHPLKGCPKKYGVSFIGSYSEYRENILKNLLDFDLHIWGPNWDKCKDKELRKHIHKESSKGKQMNLILNQSKITLNMHHPQNIHATNYRTFEALAAGCFCICEDRQDIRQLYSVGEEIILFKDADELKSNIFRFLEDDKNRQKVTEKGNKKTESLYTLNQNISRIESKIFPKDIQSIRNNIHVNHQ